MRLPTLLLGLALSLAASAAAAQAEAPRAATLKGVVGDVRIEQGPTQQTAQPGAALGVAQRLVTGTNGSAAFVTRDGTVVSVGPNSNVALSRFEFDATTQDGHFVLDMLRGSVRVVTGLIAKLNPERVRVLTPTMTVGTRGTDFIVEVF